MKLNKKGDLLLGYEPIMWIIRLLFYILVIFTMYTIINAFIIEKIDIQEVEARIFVERAVYSNNGISYTDVEIGRQYPGIIDKERLSADILEKSINFSDERSIAAYINLKSDSEEKSTYYNEKWYTRWLPLAEAKLPGHGGVKEVDVTRLILIQQDGKGIIEFKTITPNS